MRAILSPAYVYTWEGALDSRTGGLLVVIARNLKDAHDLVEKTLDHAFDGNSVRAVKKIKPQATRIYLPKSAKPRIWYEYGED